jgi:large subunit ribosomal protein L20
MTKVKHSVATKKRKKRVLKKAKGYWGDRKSQFQQARRVLAHAQVYAYRDRRVKKRDMRSLWITRITAGCRNCGISYSKFMRALKISNITLDRKMLAYLALKDNKAFVKLVEMVKNVSSNGKI